MKSHLCDFDLNIDGGWMDARSVFGQQMHMAISWLNTGKRQSVLPYEVIPRCFIVVFNYKTHQCQLRGVDCKLQRFVPTWVESIDRKSVV